jgi:hypothetical protein
VNSIAHCCNCSLGEGKKTHPPNYKGCSHAKKELLRWKAQKAPAKHLPGRGFFCRFLRCRSPWQPAVHQHLTQQQDPLVQPPDVNISCLGETFRGVTVVQQVMTDITDAVSEKEKIVAITKTVINLMKHIGPHATVAMGCSTVSSVNWYRTTALMWLYSRRHM